MKVEMDLGVDDHSTLSNKFERLASEDQPAFASYEPPFEELRERAARYSHYRNILVVGYGGSNTTLLAEAGALFKGPEKRLEIINTVSPDRLNEIRERYSPEDSLLILISKSGTTAGVLQAYLFFKGYNAVVITEDNGQALSGIAKARGHEMIVHPPIGGRFSGRTANALFPGFLLGLPMEEIDAGFRESFSECKGNQTEHNPALRLAASCYLLEERGYDQIYMPIYSPYLQDMSSLIIQLIHESSCKHGKGQTIYASAAPEAQHHTNQRFFGGRKNVIGMFLGVESYSHDEPLKVGDDIKGIGYKGDTLSVFDGLMLSRAMAFELEGTYQNAVKQGIPCTRIMLEDLSPKEIGRFIGFMQYYAVYASVLRDVSPFDQPHVEDSKSMTISMIREDAKRRRRI